MDFKWENGKRVYTPELLPGVVGPDKDGDMKFFSGLTSDEGYSCYVNARKLHAVLAVLFVDEPPTLEELKEAVASITKAADEAATANKIERGSRC